MSCFKKVVEENCSYCNGAAIKYGRCNNQQRFRCRNCKKVYKKEYLYKACYSATNASIVAHLKEGCGIRSIARLLRISATTVISRIKKVADGIKKPMISLGQIYEVDELRTFVKSKTRDCWIVYAINKESGLVIDFKVGKRTKANLKIVTDTLLISNCKQIYTDALLIYRYIIPESLHKVRRYGANRIERLNLTLRTHLKRLNRRTICFSKSVLMLEACLVIYFWA